MRRIRPVCWHIGVAVLLCLVAVRAMADATEPAPTFSIHPQSTAEALVEFAVQADISIGGTSNCNGDSKGLQGRFTIQDGLKRLLSGASCRFEMADPRTVRLTAAPPTVARPDAPPAAVEPMTIPEEMLITATKRIAAVDQLAAAVTVISAAQLTTTTAVDSLATVGQVAGMSMTNLGPGRDKIILRGLSDGTFTGRTQSTVGTYVDNLPINYNAPDPDLRLADVADVEVIRGPQGALYGGGSLSGIYRIVTRPPDMANDAASVTLSDAWTPSAAGSRAAEGMINLALIPDKAAVRLVAYGDFDGGYLGNSDTKQSDVDGTHRAGGRATIEARVDPHWTVNAVASVQNLNSADAQYTTGSSSRSRANRVSEGDRNDFAQGSVTVSETGDWGRFVSSTGYVRHVFASQYDASAALSVFDDSDRTDIGIYDESTRIEMLVEDMVATSRDGGRFQWLAGVYGSLLAERTSAGLQSRGSNPVPVLRYGEDRDDHLDEVAPYGEASYSLAEGWTVSAGARLFDTTLSTASAITLPPPGRSRTFLGDAIYRGASPKLSVQHDFSSGDLIYALVSQGYRAGGFNAGGIAVPTARQTNFAPDHLTNYEAGTKAKFFGTLIDLRSAFFYDLWTDIQTDQYLASGLSYTTNVGNARVFGTEVEANFHPCDNLSVAINALLDTSRITRVNPGFTTPVPSGLPGVPDLSMGGLAAYRIPLRTAVSLLLTSEIDYVGRSRLTFDPALSPTMGGYVTGKLSAQLETPDWRIAGVLSNPANVQGDTFSFGNPFSFGQIRQVTPLRPRTVNLVFSANF